MTQNLERTACSRCGTHHITVMGAIRVAICNYPYANWVSEALIERKLVAWCRDDEWWLPADEIGTPCPAADCPRTLVKRLMWVCSICGHATTLKRDIHDGGECPRDAGWC